MTVNRVLLIGNLGRDPELKYFDDGSAVCNFSIATSRTWKSRDGEKQEETEWHRIAVFGKLAEVCGEYLKKGRTVYIEGRLRTRQYEKDGATHYTTEIVAEEVKFLGGRRDDEGGGDGEQQRGGGGGQQRGGYGQQRQQQQRPAPQQRQQSAPKSNTGFDDMDDDIPF
ncbi:single-stranded DNA-binding protein [Aquincola tertiaricarbonis]|uniref:Single-stranded DNA-binding protein n=2 Tax=Aquincola tertiaricarbonis TaxID=391953 RepID=A0ABY4S7I1_AQUTE|nr:single-stranded DNA-binding protein [Aquincola tertiaricarbonis]